LEIVKKYQIKEIFPQRHFPLQKITIKFFQEKPCIKSGEEKLKKFIIMILIITNFIFLNALGKLQVKSIKELPPTHTNLEVRDADGRFAPVLLIKTEVKGLGIKNIGRPTKHAAIYEADKNQYKFYTNDNQRVIEITHSEYEPLEVRLLADFNIDVDAQRVYEIILLSELDKTRINFNGKGELLLKTKPSGAKVEISEFPDFNKKTPCELIDYPAISYLFHISKFRYEPIDTIITLEKNKRITRQFNLQPLWSDLEITSDPIGAKVYINEKHYGTTPLTLKGVDEGLNEGFYEIEIKKEKYYNEKLDIKIQPNDVICHNFDLTPKLGSILINTNPEGAKVEIDGKELGLTLIKIPEIVIGKHDLKISKSDFGTIKKEINVKEKKELSLNFKLDKTQEILINSDPPGANIYVDNELVSSTPHQIYLPLCKNKIKLEKKGYYSFLKNLHINPKISEYNFKLKKVLAGFVIVTYGADAIAVEYGSTYNVSFKGTIYSFGASYVKPQKAPAFVDHVNIDAFPNVDPKSEKVSSYYSWGMDFFLKYGLILEIPVTYIANLGLGYRFRSVIPIYQAKENAVLWDCENGETWTSIRDDNYTVFDKSFWPIMFGFTVPIVNKMVISCHYWTTFNAINDIVIGFGFYY